MATRLFGTAITIHDFEGVELGNGNTFTDPKRGKQFLDNVENALRGLKKLSTGQKLLSEIEGSGKTIDILCAGKGKDGCAMTKPNGDFAAQYAAQIVSFRPGVKNLEWMQKDRTSNAGIAGRTVDMPSRGEEFYEQKYTAHLGFKQTDKNMSPNLVTLLERMKTKYLDPLKMMSSVTGKSTIELQRMANGITEVDDSTYYKICVFFYDFLQRGTGCNTQVRLMFDVGLPDTQGGKNYKKTADAVDPRIMAGHELIHAWRMMMGGRIVRSGWEEEAMTVGLSFAAGWAITENRLRLEAGHPRRPRYSGKTDISSFWGGEQKQNPNQ